MPDDRQLARQEPEPRRVTATPDDVIGPGEREVLEEDCIDSDGQPYTRRSWSEPRRSNSDYISYDGWGPPLRNLRISEADAPPSSGHDPAISRVFLREHLQRVQDPALRRTLLEEYHREAQ